MKLVSENLRDKFGEIYLEVISQDRTKRTSCIRRASDGEALSYSTVAFNEAGIEALGKVHDDIVAGGSMGEVIKKSGVAHERSVSVTSSAALNFGLSFLFGTKKPFCNTEKITYKIKSVPYAEIHEFYNPEYAPAVTQEAEYSVPVNAPEWFLIAPFRSGYEVEYPQAALLAENRDAKVFVAADRESFIGSVALGDGTQEIFVEENEYSTLVREALLEYAISQRR